MRTFKRILSIIASFTAGAVTGSLWILNDESWRDFLPVVLCCVTLRMHLDND